MKLSKHLTRFAGFVPAFLMLASLFSGGCAHSKIIRSSGLAYIKIGDNIPPVGADRLKRHSVRDSIFEDEEYTWRASIVEYGKGKVYLEEDFFTRELLNRIRIETPELRLRNGLRVGNTVADLVATTDNWQVVPMKKFELFEFSSAMYPRIHFVVDDPTVAMESDNWEDYPLENFSTSAPVKMIVIY